MNTKSPLLVFGLMLTSLWLLAVAGSMAVLDGYPLALRMEQTRAAATASMASTTPAPSKPSRAL